MSQPSNSLLRVRQLQLKANQHTIVDNISFDLHPGEVLGLVGESGAGKSSLGLATMGYARAGCEFTAGSVEFRGQDLLAMTEKQRRELRGRDIAYVAQSAAASFNPAHCLLDQFCESPTLHNVSSLSTAREDAVQLYQQMQLPNPQQIGWCYPHQLSGGQLQRAMTAMAMACRPQLIIFDEPTTALDVTTQIEVLAAIRGIVEKYNTAAIYITHDLAVVAQMADRIMVLKDGKTVEQAPTRSILSAPTQDYTRSLWSVRALQVADKSESDQRREPLLTLRDVHASYGDKAVLHGINFDVARGRTVAVVGESGSGKSTMAKVISGLLPPRQGEILFAGQPLAGNYRQRQRADLRHIQFIYQMPDTALNPRQRIGDIIGRPLSFYLGLRGEQKQQRVRELLSLIELDPDQFMHRRPEELSGGQKQRVGIARALAAEPEFIICDEVTSALDQLVAEGILKLLMRLQRELNIAYLFITHDLATVRGIADDILVMNQGRIVEQGTKRQVLQPPHHPYTELLLSSVPEMDPDWLTRRCTEQRNKDTIHNREVAL
ncbi:ABC transporter [Bacterioplanes sanyensis]|uniref:ABC transporter n=1 Tax=Bacterioplanes sanyensis TaxID=1249553 RepID=A0A222FFP3_9GAMM|nr:ABC transporter ATP-binding protein [Bacterioplanes sanyensis]ASP37314.1 ABC transporter [Bacterioplanes sanyensis]